MLVAFGEGGMPIFWDKIHYGERGGAGHWGENEKSAVSKEKKK
jgi:hypothetical protein